MEQHEIVIPIPGGQQLIAKGYANGDYPTIQIFLRDENGADELICFAEHNPEGEPGHEVCIGVYDSMHEDTAYYESYKY